MSEKYRFETHEYSEEAEVITVDQTDGWKLAKAPNVIETTGLGPCVGIIVYDPESKQAMVGHFVDPMVDDFPGMLDQAVKMFPDRSKLKVYVGGGAPEPEDAPHFRHDKEKRAFIKKQLADHGLQNSQITTHYHNSMDSTILRIDTSTGEVDYDEESEWEDDDNY